MHQNFPIVPKRELYKSQGVKVICTNQVLLAYVVLKTINFFYAEGKLILSDITFQILLGHCIRKYEGGCSNSKDLLLKNGKGVHTGEFTLHDCYQLCLAHLDFGCDGFSLQKDGSTCQLFKKGCQRRMDDPPMWDFYEMKDCPGIA